MNALKYIFIVPYRDRIEHKTFFSIYMTHILEDYDDSTYDIVYCHQCDNRKFNRGAMKNIGFLYCKEKYPETYIDLIYIFNDVDSIPYKKGLLNYDIEEGVVKHYYGYEFALGGIFAIKGSDFEKINGFPNYWNWGFEDNVINKRVLSKGLKIDRSEFFDIFSKKILHFVDDFKKMISYNTFKNMKNSKFIESDGLNTIKNLSYIREGEMLNITSFDALYPEHEKNYIEHNIFKGNKVQLPRKSNAMSMNLFGNKKSMI